MNSALQRARATLGGEQPERTGARRPPRAADRELLDRYVDSVRRCDLTALVALARSDAAR